MSRLETLHIQSVLYNNEPNRIIKSLESIKRAADFAIHEGIFGRISISYGDGSSIPIFTEEEVRELSLNYKEYFDINYFFFNANLGSARGHNYLGSNCVSDYMLIINPDILMASDTIKKLREPFDNSTMNVGIVEAKQLPIEHPKNYNVNSGETSWASTACAMFPQRVFKEVEGFDADTFFLYCDDVDFSWMVRLKGYKVIYQPSAAVFHDKTLSVKGMWQTSDAEDYYSAEAGLLMAYKWSRNDILQEVINYFEQEQDGHYKKALEEFYRRRSNGNLPKQLDPHNKVGEFHRSNYGKMRYSI